MTDRRPPLVEVGSVDRAHGLLGQVLVRLVSNEPSRLEPGSRLQLPDGRALTVRTATAHQHRWLVAFDELADRQAAEAVVGAPLLVEAVLGDPDSYWIHDLIGAAVVDPAGGAHGEVVEVLANPASDILVLSTGALVPLRFATWVSEGRLRVDGPEGLLE